MLRTKFYLNEIDWESLALTSAIGFDVGRWTLDVECYQSSFAMYFRTDLIEHTA